MIRLTLDPSGDSVTSSLTAYLGDNFGSYRNACVNAGARYVPSERVNRIPVASVGNLITELDKAKLPVEIEANVAKVLKAEAARAGELLAAGRERVETAKARLAEAGLSPFRYQETGIEWLAPRKTGLLLDDMGLGKTIQALLAVPDGAPVVVIVPTGVRANWAAEIRVWRPDFTVNVIKSSSRFVWPEAGEITLATYTTTPKVDAEMPAPEIGTYLIADEIHLAKNGKAARTKRLAALIDLVAAHEGTTWGLTGTPLLNRPTELWSIFKTFGVAEKSFGSWHSFVRLFGGHKDGYGYSWKGADSNEKVAAAIRKVALRRMKAEVLKDLPSKRRVERRVNDLDKSTLGAADRLVALLAERGIDLTRPDLLDKARGLVFQEMSAARRALAVAKIPALIELAESYEEAEEPVVVFSCHREPVLELGKRDGWAVILGDTDPEERGRIVEDFQAGRLKGIAGTVRAMGVGVTLTNASHLIFVDLDWTPALNAQAEDRIVRIGQKASSALITILVADHPLDARVAELIQQKLTYIDSVNAAAVAEDYVSESPAEALTAAAEAAVAKVVDLDARAKEAAAEAAVNLEATKKTVKARLGDDHDGRDLDISSDGRFRSAANVVEEHAAESILTLSAMDPDRAAEKNNVGWNGSDGPFGHSLAAALKNHGRLSDKQWKIAVKMIKKYHRQIGKAPVAESR